jgi:hypothetical protein
MNSLRPDETAALSEIERSSDRDRKVKGSLGAIAGTGLAGASAALGSRIAPFLSELIPSDLAIKGISKIAPSIGNFLKKGQSMGLDIGEGLQFVRDSIGGKESPKEPEEEEDIILRFSPKLSEFVRKAVQNGSPISEVESLARSPGQKFNKTIAYLEKSLGMTFYDVIRSIYGGKKKDSGKVQQPASQMQATQQQPPVSQQPAGQPGQGQAALMAILQKLQQARGNP